MYPGKGTVVLIRPAQTFYERIKVTAAVKEGDLSAEEARERVQEAKHDIEAHVRGQG